MRIDVFIVAAIGAIMFGLSSCAQQHSISGNSIAEDAPAFPGAEGFGKYATGGRGGNVLIISTLADDGPGSLRQAVESKGKKIVVFTISGTIHLESKLNITANTTIAGQSAPGDGICVADQPVTLGGDNIIIRYMRFRMGDKYQRGGMVNGNGGDDAFGGTRRKHIIIDHCSMSWSTDEVFSVYAGDSTTLQWNIISEPLNYSYHFETGDKDYEHHGYGGIWGGRNLTAHHNLFAHCVSRNPRFNGARLGATEEFVDYRNNVIYNWGQNNVYGGEGGNYNIVGNYYRYGPGTSKTVRARIVNPTRTETIGFGRFFVQDNFVEDATDVTANNKLGVHPSSDKADSIRNTLLLADPLPAIAINTEKASDAFRNVLAYVGASYHRDTLDARIINDVKTRKGRYIDVQGGYPHGTDYLATVNAWPQLRTSEPLLDTDKDGMPDEWERKNKLNPDNPADAKGNDLHSIYSNIEVYLNGLLNYLK